MRPFIWLLALLPILSFANDISGRVVSVSDGDTLTILDSSKVQHKIRLAAIDAPEKDQSFGQFSKKSLSDTCFERQAVIDVVDIDRYGRSVGVVQCENVNANESQLNLGAAWVYIKYAKGFERYFKIEKEAKAQKRGLWAEPQPTPPWEWRKTNR